MPSIVSFDHFTSTEINLEPLAIQRPLLLIGHGTKNDQGRQTFLDFAATYQQLDTSRPVIPCFLELTGPTIEEGVQTCIDQGYTELSALPILLFAARHNKFDVTNELDRCRTKYPQLKFHYGRHFGINPSILDLWHGRLAQLDDAAYPRSETLLLFVGRGSSDPDANGDLCKLARMIWEGSGYHSVETCFIGITHPRLEEGFRRAFLHKPKRIIVLPYFLFTGTLVEKIFSIAAEQQAQSPDVKIDCLPEMGIQPELLQILRTRELETQLGLVNMNCESCKFRLAALGNPDSHHHGHDHGEHGHSHDHSHEHNHGHHHHHSSEDPYAEPEAYHDRIWQVP
ncbi:MAG: sirohydrochlorin chelatase [Synechococcaceae cyanobacterium RL_1_2]|nr:sirohydrochlorin chelatase [Synechococcaceae cyanobacterium RL_1_2]